MALLETDPVDWALDADGDLIMPITYTRGPEAVAQGIRRALLLVRGELFYNLDAGVPYLEGNGVDPTLVILGRAFDRVRAEAAIREAIVGSPSVPGVVGVSRIVSLGLEFDGQTRKLRVAVRVESVFGDTIDVTQDVVV